MENLNSKIIIGMIFLTISSISYSKHCDDEDYSRDSKSKTNITSDSLQVSSNHHNET